MMGFGRRFMDMTMEEVRAIMLYQLGALEGIAKTYDAELNHVKPHGALYNATFTDYELSLAIADAVKEYDPKLKLMGLSNQNLVKAGKEAGLEVRHGVFADRAYEDDGTRVSSRKEGAVITDTDEAVKRVGEQIKEDKVERMDARRQ